MEMSIEAYKKDQSEQWSNFAPAEIHTTVAAGRLVDFIDLVPGKTVLDVGCGTGVVAVTAARKGAKSTGIDLCTELLEKAKWNAEIAGTTVEFLNADAESLPFADQSFDFVVSQFGHIFAPSPALAFKEMVRVLKNGGTLAFAAWPPHSHNGDLFALIQNFHPLPPFVTRPQLWGDESFVRELTAPHLSELYFKPDILLGSVLSPAHVRLNLEKTIGPAIRCVQELQTNERKLAEFRQKIEALIEKNTRLNQLEQKFLLVKGKKKSRD